MLENLVPTAISKYVTGDYGRIQVVTVNNFNLVFLVYGLCIANANEHQTTYTTNRISPLNLSQQNLPTILMYKILKISCI
jgi:hypothetical protein